MKILFRYIKDAIQYLWRFYFGGHTPDIVICDPVEPTEPETPAEPDPEPEEPEINVDDMIPQIEPGGHKLVVCLDNGHGEDTPGKCSPWSACKVPPEIPFREYAYCREIVSRLAKVLHDDGFPVYIVTPEETDTKLAVRGQRINTVVKDAKKSGLHTISISIHNNAAGNGREWKKAYGWSVWTTRGQNNSDILAQCLYDSAKEILKDYDQVTRHDISDGDDDYEDNFAMCRMPNCPAVLTENMFQDCVKEVQFLLTEEGKNAIVEIHRQGIKKFAEKMGW